MPLSPPQSTAIAYPLGEYADWQKVSQMDEGEK